MSLRSVILVALAEADHSGYEITKEFETVLGFFWNASHQQVYRELKKMDTDGLVQCRLEPQEGKPDRKVYSMTEEGRQALATWLAEPASPAPVRSALLVKVYAGMMLEPQHLSTHIETFQSEANAALTRFKAIEKEHYPEDLSQMEDWKKLAYLTLRFGELRRAADAEWATEALEVLKMIGRG